MGGQQLPEQPEPSSAAATGTDLAATSITSCSISSMCTSALDSPGGPARECSQHALVAGREGSSVAAAAPAEPQAEKLHERIAATMDQLRQHLRRSGSAGVAAAAATGGAGA